MKFGIPSALILTALACALLAGCSRGSMPPTKVNAHKFVALIECADQVLIAEKKLRGATSDTDRKSAAQKRLVEPFRKLGFDLGATLFRYATHLHKGDLTGSEEWVVVMVLREYQQNADDLTRWGFIKTETKDLVVSVHDKVQ